MHQWWSKDIYLGHPCEYPWHLQVGTYPLHLPREESRTRTRVLLSNSARLSVSEIQFTSVIISTRDPPAAILQKAFSFSILIFFSKHQVVTAARHGFEFKYRTIHIFVLHCRSGKVFLLFGESGGGKKENRRKCY